MPDLKSAQPSSIASAKTGPTVQCIMVTLDKVVVAIPIDRVDKVVKQATVVGSGLSHMGITHYAGEPVTVVDLQYQLFQRWSEQSSDNQDTYLIIAKTSTQGLLAFPIQAAPDLIEFAVSELRVLPSSYRRADTLGIASHVVRVAQPSGEDLSIFILDLDYLASQCGNPLPLATA